MSSLRILIVEDEIIIGWALKAKLEQFGHRVLSIVPSADKAVAAARDESPELIFMDIKLNGPRTGIDAAGDIRSFSDVPIVYLSGNINLVSEEQVQVTRPVGIYSKPPSDEELHAICEATRQPEAPPDLCT